MKLLENSFVNQISKGLKNCYEWLRRLRYSVSNIIYSCMHLVLFISVGGDQMYTKNDFLLNLIGAILITVVSLIILM